MKGSWQLAKQDEEEARSQKQKEKPRAEAKILNHRGRRGTRRKIPQSGTKAVLCHRFSRMNTDFKSKTRNYGTVSEGLPVLRHTGCEADLVAIQ
jgi:hypothetical protein